MRIRLVVVGNAPRDPLCVTADEYLARLEHRFSVELVCVKDESKNASTPVPRILRAEADRIRKTLDERDFVVALDERGAAWSSTELAKKIEGWALRGVPRVAFVIGGANGLDPELLAKANARWSLSSLTLPHRIARLLVSEQLYRSATILNNEPYHK